MFPCENGHMCKPQREGAGCSQYQTDQGKGRRPIDRDGNFATWELTLRTSELKETKLLYVVYPCTYNPRTVESRLSVLSLLTPDLRHRRALLDTAKHEKHGQSAFLMRPASRSKYQAVHDTFPTLALELRIASCTLIVGPRSCQAARPPSPLDCHPKGRSTCTPYSVPANMAFCVPTWLSSAFDSF